MESAASTWTAEEWSYLAVTVTTARGDSAVTGFSTPHLPVAQQPLVGQGFSISEGSRSHLDTPDSVALL